MNYRSEKNPLLQEMIVFIKEKGRLPVGSQRDYFDEGVTFIRSEEEFKALYRESLTLNPGPQTVAVNYTNRSRCEYEAIASDVFAGVSTPVFKGASLTAAESKEGDALDSFGMVTTFSVINSETVEILSDPKIEVIPNTGWATPILGQEIKALKCLAMPKISRKKINLYVTPFMGEASGKIKDKCPYAALIVASSSLYNSIVKLSTGDDLHLFRKSLLESQDLIPVGIRGRGDVHPSQVMSVLREIRERLSPSARDIFYEKLCSFVGGNEGEALRNLGMENPQFKSIATSYIVLAAEDGKQLASVLSPRAEYMRKSIPSLFWASVFNSVKSRILRVRIKNSLTCHNAQGQGRNEVFLNAKEIHQYTKGYKDKRKALLYVGASRAKEKLTILV